MHKIILTLSILLLSLVQIGCTSQIKESILIIAVDGLSSTDVSCNQTDDLSSGFQILCHESVRFTHAFTTSTLAVPAMTSVLTGLFPYQHKVRHNSQPAAAPELELVSELAIQKGYRTSFYSGGAPILRKSGLQQGFEIFDDNFNPSFSSLHRPFIDNVGFFLNWVEDEVKNDAFLSVLYVPDLRYTQVATSNEMGDLRNLSFESQLEELNENLHFLIQRLKKIGRWEKTTLILVGLKGRGQNRSQEINPLNLHSENTQVALFIKPTQPKKRDRAINWKVDLNVSIADIGATVKELLKIPESTQNSKNGPAALSLLPYTKNTSEEWKNDRTLLVESGWATWKKLGSVRMAFIQDQYLYIHDNKSQLYNTLVDRFENNRLPLSQESNLYLVDSFEKIAEKNHMQPFWPVPGEIIAKLRLPYPLWAHPGKDKDLYPEVQKLLKKYPGDLDLSEWTAALALSLKDWEQLKSLGTFYQNPLWKYVAEKNLGLKTEEVTDSCFKLLSLPAESLKDVYKDCNDTLFLEFVDYTRATERGLNKETQFKKLERSYKIHLLDQTIRKVNIGLNLVWDVNHERQWRPSRVDLALALPENIRLKNQLNRLSNL